MIRLVYLLLLFLISFSTQAQLQRPDEFLPHQLGEHFTPHHLLVDYFEHVASQSDQLILAEYGRTNQDRPLVYGILSSVENLKNIEAIRTNNLKKNRINGGAATAGGPTIVWLGFGVHGNEAGASESSIATLYELVNQSNEAVQNWLKDAVIIIDPCINPDGYSRYTHWNRNASNIIPDVTPEGREHQEPWPGGRMNHYHFDLNRDWAWQTQVESKQRMVIYHQWMPHVHVDFHEMGHNDHYYFAPAAEPFHQYISAWQSDFQHEIGKNHTKYFDTNNWAYFTREVFDLFYPSYGDTYPTFHGAIGMTYEQAGHSMAGRAIALENGDTLTLVDRIAHHKATALSTVEICANNAQKLTQEFADYFKTTSSNPEGKYKSFVIKKENAPDKIKSFCEMLDRNAIRYGKVGVSKSLRAFDYTTGKERMVSINEGDLLISAHQPLAVLTQVLLEPEPFLSDSLTYDITAWALPFAFGLDAYAFTEKMDASGPYEHKKHKIVTDENAYAYVLSWGSLEDSKFLGLLLEKGIVVRYSLKAFEIENQKFDAGSLVILKSDNRNFKANLDKHLQALAASNERTLTGLSTGFATRGNDLGSGSFKLIQKPRVALLQSTDISPYNFGEAWQFLDAELNYTVTVLPTSVIGNNKLNDYNVLVMAEGSYGLDSLALGHLRNWIKNGGRVIALGSAVKSFENKKGFALKKEGLTTGKSKNIYKDLKSFGEQERDAITKASPGALIRQELDQSHPLAFGLGSNYFTLKNNSRKYKYLKNGWNVAYTKNNPFVVGFVGFEAKRKLNNSLTLGVEQIGSGSIVYMVDNPLFRSFWYTGEMMFTNAIFFR